MKRELALYTHYTKLTLCSFGGWFGPHPRSLSHPLPSFGWGCAPTRLTPSGPPVPSGKEKGHA